MISPVRQNDVFGQLGRDEIHWRILRTIEKDKKTLQQPKSRRVKRARTEIEAERQDPTEPPQTRWRSTRGGGTLAYLRLSCCRNWIWK